MRYQLIGVNHNTAPVELRERLNIPGSSMGEALQRLLGHPGVDEGLILCTCNRVEILVQTKNGSSDLRSFLQAYFEMKVPELQPHLYEYHERDAIRHLFRVTSSLDSMVVGEPQILGQVKEAYATARAVGAEIELAVRDSGIGFRASDHEQLFRKFSRLNAGAGSRYYGTGLGLFIVQRLMQLSGGRVSASSEGLGRGAEFLLHWPSAPVPP